MSWLHVSTAERTALDNFKTCAEQSPKGTYEDCKALKNLIDDATDGLICDLHAIGFQANNCDLIYAIESAIYQYVKLSNPDSTVFPVSEGFGEAMDSPARERVLEQAAANRDFLLCHDLLG